MNVMVVLLRHIWRQVKDFPDDIGELLCQGPWLRCRQRLNLHLGPVG
ncbi:MAG TPA: hypothetical protein VIK18_05330 [Pirellulales bacterium]